MLDPWILQTLGGSEVLSTGLLIAFKVTLILLLTRFGLLAMCRMPASIRHLTIALALLASLVVPILAWVLPSWDVVPRLATPSFETFDMGQKPSGHSAIAADSGGAVLSPTISETVGSSDWLLLGWSLGALALLALLITRVLASNLAVRRAEPIVDENWLALLATIQRRLGLSLAVELRRRSGRAMPLVWGLVRPTVLLPEDCDTWSVERRRAVLAHELGHVSRRDIPVTLIGHLACAVHWFNPLVWWLQRRLTLERELACDQLVVEQGVPSAIYADQLLETAMAYRGGASLSPVMAARSQLEGRIMAILESTSSLETSPSRKRSRVTEVLVAVLVTLVLLPIASLTFAAPAVPEAGSDPDLMADERSLEVEAKRLQDALEALQARMSKGGEDALPAKERRLVQEQMRELHARSAEMHARFGEVEARRMLKQQLRDLEARSSEAEEQARLAEAQRLELELWEKAAKTSKVKAQAGEEKAQHMLQEQHRAMRAESVKMKAKAHQANARRLELELQELEARASMVDERALAEQAKQLEEELQQLEERASEIHERVREAEARRLEAKQREHEGKASKSDRPNP